MNTYTVLPLPTGRFIVALCDVTMQGAPVAYQGVGLNGQRGVYHWRLRELPATLFYTYRDANNCARSLSSTAPQPRFDR